jgi:N-acetylglucosamine-6-phosphate deacetylase
MTASPVDLLEISRRLPAEGTTSWLPTVITAPLHHIERIDRVIAEAMRLQRQALRRVNARAGPMPEAAILGMHLEGPFISPKQLGTHPPLNLSPTGEPLERVLRLSTLKLITLAPELDGALDAIGALVRKRVAVSIGHTDATYEQATAGVKAGARMFTHVYNAMAPLHHRAPGAAVAALVEAGAMAALIPDAVHVHPTMLRLAWRARGATGTIFTSDRTSLAGSEAVSAPLFGGTANASVVGGVARLADGTLAGSVITMLDGLHLTAQRLVANGWSLNGVLSEYGEMSAFGPSAILGLTDRGRIEPGWRADLIVLDRDLNLKAVFVGGRELD